MSGNATRFELIAENFHEEVLQENQGRIAVYSTEVCPKCNRLKQYMNSLEIPFIKLDMQSPEGQTELRFNGIFVLEAPVLQINERFFTTKQLFQGTEIKEEIKAILGQYAK
jgi:glutaredoxin